MSTFIRAPRRIADAAPLLRANKRATLTARARERDTHGYYMPPAGERGYRFVVNPYPANRCVVSYARRTMQPRLEMNVGGSKDDAENERDMMFS